MKTFFQKIFLLGVMMLLTLGASATPDRNYLCFTANTAPSTVRLCSMAMEKDPDPVQLEYSSDGNVWLEYYIGVSISLDNPGDKVYFRNAADNVAEGFSSLSGYYQFEMSGSIAASGNIMSLIDKSVEATAIPCTRCFSSLFESCSALTSAPELPATTLAEGCYDTMFADCRNLTTAPALPATTLSPFCYSAMFASCRALVLAPELPATTLAYGCYGNMFRNCISLTTAPALPATTLAYGCYEDIFNGCKKLNKVEVGFADWGESHTANWLNGVAAMGDFICPDGLSKQMGASYIPEDWSINGSETMPPYLNFTANAPSSCVQLNMVGGESAGLPLEYYVEENRQWKSYTFTYDADSNSSIGQPITLANAGDKVYFRKSGDGVATGFSTSDNSYYRFSVYGSVAADGNIMSLIDKHAETTTIPGAYCFAHLFESCTGLTAAPQLPATTLKPYCYASMFSGCTGLTAAPALPATTLEKDCYNRMFYYCTKLNEIKVGFTEWTVTVNEIEYTPTKDWLYNVSSGGVFTGHAGLDKTQRDASHIPAGWMTMNYRCVVTANSSDESKGTVSGSGTYADGTEVTLTATPAEGYIFKQWSDGTTANPYVFNATKDVNLTAQFAKGYTVQVASADESKGSVSGGGTYEEGTEVMLIATPAEYYEFEKWSDGTTANPYVFTAEKNVELTASFSKIICTITVVSNNERSGTVTGGGTYEAGEEVTVTATPAEGYRFIEWSNGSTDKSCRFIATHDIVLEATFVKAAWDFIEGGIGYKVNGERVSVVGCDNPPANMVIPGTVTHNGKTYRVTRIEEFVFANNQNLSSVMISNGVKEIATSAFAYCNNLTEVILGTDVSYIDLYAFAFCKNLKDVYFWSLTPPEMSAVPFNEDICCYIPNVPDAIMAYEGLGDSYSCFNTVNIYKLDVAPSDAKVIIDGRQYKNGDAVGVGGSLSNPLCNVMQPSDVKKDEAAMFGYDLTSVSIWNGTIHVEYTANSSVVFTDATPFGYANEKTFPELTYSREFTNTEWQALYVPFSMSYDEWKNDCDIAKIVNVIQYDDNEDGDFDRTYLVVRHLTTGSIKPNCPYLVRAKQKGTCVLYLGERTLKPAEDASVECRSTECIYTFTGTYTGVADMEAKGYYALVGGSLKQAASSEVPLNPQRWYLNVESIEDDYNAATKAQSIRILVEGEDDTEGINGLAPKVMDAQSVFDLMGRRMMAPVKGINIVNGKKIIK